MRSFVHFGPIATSIFSLWFGTVLVRRYRERGGMHHFWWAIGAFAYAAGTITESITTLFGWQEPVFSVATATRNIRRWRKPQES